MRMLQTPQSPELAKSPFKISVITDEVSQDFGHACEVASQRFGMGWVEIRSLWNKNIVNLVMQEKVAAGAFSNDDRANLDEKVKPLISILGESESVPRHLVSVRKDLPEPVRLGLEQILLSMHRDEEGQTILRKTDNTTKFDSLPGGEEAVRRKLVELYCLRGKK